MNDHRVKKLAPDDAEPGAILAASVYDKSGQLLVRAGTVLSEEVLIFMRRRFLDSVWVCVPRTDDAGRLPARTRDQERLAQLFRLVRSTAAASALREKILNFRYGGLP